MKFNIVRALSVLLLASCLTSFAGETVHFFGTWEPRPALVSFWKPMKESWWITGPGTKNPRIARHCEEYARRHTPEELVPEMVMDLKRNPSEVRWFVYLHVMMEWPQNVCCARLIRVIDQRMKRFSISRASLSQILSDTVTRVSAVRLS
jgi:hypothetical protein